MMDAAQLNAVIRNGDEAFAREDVEEAVATWRQALAAAPLTRGSQLLSRLGLSVSPRSAKLLRVLQVLEDAFPNAMPFVADGLAVWLKLNPFVADKAFCDTASKHAEMLPLANWHWNLQTVIWALRQARRLPGDFVELGVF